ncbi:MAG: glutamate-5-semialdehyde dehydrogenase [Candidatus Omnitrophica bacterium]|nr:glutamate-5-semialdehyde dehydrogenase [Candidatus Omnitrophota bacterium]
MDEYVKQLSKKAKVNSYLFYQLNTEIKNKALLSMADALWEEKYFILSENKKDVDKAKAKGMKKSFIDRLSLDEKRISQMCLSLKEIANLKDPIGEVICGWRRPNGLFINKVRVPIGVILIIYEARPNVTSDCMGLCFKSSNISILRGGSDSINSNLAIFKVLKEAVRKSGINFDPFFLVEKTEHEVIEILLKEKDNIDLVIPRGGEELIKKVTESSLIPVIKHYKGVCHIFVDEFARLNMAINICLNAKVQRPSVCNAVETILVHKKVAGEFLPLLKQEFDKYNVRIRGDEKALQILEDIELANESDWFNEYLDLIVSLRVVDSIDEAIAHINLYGSHHTDSIITENINNATKFVNEVDSACCFVNVSTRFSDGYEFGLGAEIGISTDKLHARGPMGLEELTTYKYVVYGSGQIRS